MRMPKLKALTRECRLRGYSQLRKAELIQLIQNNQPNTNPPLQSWEPNQPPRPTRPSLPPPGQSATQTWEPIDDRLRLELEAPRGYRAPLTKRQLKHRRNKDF